MSLERTLRCLLAVAPVWLAADSAGGEDVVWLRREQGRGTLRLTGEVVDYTGVALTLRTPGREVAYDAARVVDVQSAWLPEHRQADAAFAKKQWADAVEAYDVASRAEPRMWVRRRLMAQMCFCRANLGETAAAAELFRLIYESDSQTQYYHCIPLNWTAAAASPEIVSRAAGWMATDQPGAMRLIGASWLLTAQQPAAVETLRSLLTDVDRRTASLAQAQLWRPRALVANAAEVERWERQLRTLPRSLRGGPALVLGAALSRMQRHEDASLLLLRSPLEQPEQAVVASESLLAAARELDKMGRPEAARRLLDELEADHPESHAAAAVRSLNLSTPRKP